MAVSINSVNIPAPMNQRGRYKYEPFRALRKNGEGAVTAAGTGRVVWAFARLSLADWAWWTTTLLDGAPSLTAEAVLWDDDDDETSFDSVTVHYPLSDGVKGGYHHNVEIVIDDMIPA